MYLAVTILAVLIAQIVQGFPALDVKSLQKPLSMVRYFVIVILLLLFCYSCFVFKFLLLFR